MIHYLADASQYFQRGDGFNGNGTGDNHVRESSGSGFTGDRQGGGMGRPPGVSSRQNAGHVGDGHGDNGWGYEALACSGDGLAAIAINAVCRMRP